VSVPPTQFTTHRPLTHTKVFLAQLFIASAFLLSEVLLHSSVLSIPYKLVFQRLFPDHHVEIHPYFASGLLFVSVTTLVLFFASGMYSEKIAYANQSVFSLFV
jgi:hypothetical protein